MQSPLCILPINVIYDLISAVNFQGVWRGKGKEIAFVFDKLFPYTLVPPSSSPGVLAFPAVVYFRSGFIYFLQFSLVEGEITKRGFFSFRDAIKAGQY